MYMMTHGVQNPNIIYKDSLSDQNTDAGKYTKILTNPPFKGSLDYDIVATDLIKVKNQENGAAVPCADAADAEKRGGMHEPYKG